MHCDRCYKKGLEFYPNITPSLHDYYPSNDTSRLKLFHSAAARKCYENAIHSAHINVFRTSLFVSDIERTLRMRRFRPSQTL